MKGHMSIGVAPRTRRRSTGLECTAVEKQIAAYVFALEMGWEKHEAIKPRKPSRKACPKGLRKAVFAAFQVCEYCGCEPTKENYRTVDRIVAGAAYEPSNVTMACLLCNSNKGRMEYIGPARSLTIKEARNA